MDNKVFVKLNNGIYGVYGNGTNLFTENNEVCDKILTNFTKVDESSVPSKTRKLLNQIFAIKKKKIRNLYKKEDIQKEIDTLQAKIKELENQKNILTNEQNEYQKDIDKLVKDYNEKQKLSAMKKLVKGNEILKMSFTDGTLDKIKAKVIILKSKRPITYTYGFSYGNPTTYHVPQTVEEAFNIIDTESFLDIDFTKNEIHLNAFSGNDMW